MSIKKIILIITLVVLGLMANILVLFATRTVSEGKYDVTAKLCSGYYDDMYVTYFNIQGGLPLKTHFAYNTLAEKCSVTGHIDYGPNINYLRTNLKMWQFYANTAVWALLVSAVYVIGKRAYAHNRH